MRILSLKGEATCPRNPTLQGSPGLGGGGGVRRSCTEAQERPFLLEPANHGMGASSIAPLPLLTSFGLGLTPPPSHHCPAPLGTLSLARIELAMKHQPGVVWGGEAEHVTGGGEGARA